MLYRDTEELAENKLLLLFILSEVKTPLTKNEITQIIMENNFMNYFAMQQLLGELVESGFVTYYEDKAKHYYRLEEKGANTLKLFVSRIPQKIRQKILEYLSENQEQMKREKQIVGRYTIEAENEYLVTLKIIEHSKTTFDLELRVSSHKLARKICENWDNNAPLLFGSIINTLINLTND
jgi:predicted transcriptional regulator